MALYVNEKMLSDSLLRDSLTKRMKQKYKLSYEAEEKQSCEELCRLLENHERDLILAAEIGSALLDKNEEISKQRELKVVEFSSRLEVI